MGKGNMCFGKVLICAVALFGSCAWGELRPAMAGTGGVQPQGVSKAVDDTETLEIEVTESDLNDVVSPLVATTSNSNLFPIMYNGETIDSSGFYQLGIAYGDAFTLLEVMKRKPSYSQEKGLSFVMMNGVRAYLKEDGVSLKYDYSLLQTDEKKLGLRVVDPMLGAPLLIKEGVPKINLKVLASMANLTGTWYKEENIYFVKSAGYKTELQSKQPYQLLLEKSKFKLTVYAADDLNKYRNVVREIKTATGRTDVLTPLGNHKIIKKELWHEFNNKWYAKYATEYADGLYIHSELYRNKDLNQLSKTSQDNIGKKATSGCLRTYLADAKWIYDNCPIGTELRIVK